MSENKQTSIEGNGQIMEVAPIPIFAVDAKGKVTFWSDRMEDLTGKSALEMKGKKAWNAFFTKKAKTPVELMLVSEEEEREDRFEFTNSRTGEKHQVSFVANPKLDDNDEIVGGVAVLVTEESAGETSSLALADLHRIPTPVMRIDKDYNVTFMNVAGAAVAGKTPDQTIGMKCYDIFKTEHCNTPECRCAQAMQKDTICEGETVADPHGLNLPISYTGAPVKDEQGNIIGALEYVVDITRTKEAMRDAEVKVDYLNNIPTPVMVIDKDFNIVYMNPGGAGVAGKTPAQVVGTKCYDLFKTPHCHTSECRCAQAMQNDGVFTGETVADPSGLNIPIEYTGAPIKNEQGEIIGALEYVLNISDRKAVLKDIIGVVEAMARNDLTALATGDYEGDFLAIADNLNRGVKAQHKAMVQVADAVEQIASASNQIAASSQSVAQGASEQASSLEETSSALEEMAGQTKQNADNTMTAKGLAENTRGTANEGATSMEKMMDSMVKIKGAAEGTAEIIKDINDIAFQTNLLALNAAVEAARAGDAGRGFAVVAEEVRNLAGRAKEAAKKTEDLIKESVSLAENGEKISNEVNGNLSEIVDSVSKVTDLVGEISAASEEQAQGIGQVNKAIAEMDTVVQQSAANSEESSSAAQELSGQAQELSAMVGRFVLNRTAKRPPEQTKAPMVRPVAAKKERRPESVADMNPEAFIPLEDDEVMADF